MLDMVLAGVVAAALAIGAAYVTGAIRVARRQGSLIRYTGVGLFWAVVAVSAVLATMLGVLVLFLVVPIVAFLAPLCALASAMVAVRERQSHDGARLALAVGAVLCFGVWAAVLMPKLERGLAGMNPDGHGRSSLATPSATRAS